MSVYSAPWYTPAVQRLLDLALEEDVGRGDVTSASVIDGEFAENSENRRWVAGMIKR